MLSKSGLYHYGPAQKTSATYTLDHVIQQLLNTRVTSTFALVNDELILEQYETHAKNSLRRYYIRELLQSADLTHAAAITDFQMQ